VLSDEMSRLDVSPIETVESDSVFTFSHFY
jgi:hypothetical protein